MEILMIICGIVFIFIGIYTLRNPNNALEKKDKYRIKGRREYTEIARFQINTLGLVIIFSGIFMIVIQILLLFAF